MCLNFYIVINDINDLKFCILKNKIYFMFIFDICIIVFWKYLKGELVIYLVGNM